jgi:hypothetical protein
MRQLGGERGENGFENGELEVGDGHGENPSFLQSLSSLSVGDGRETKQTVTVRKPGKATTPFFSF